MPLSDWIGLSGLSLVWILLLQHLPFFSRQSLLKRLLVLSATYWMVMAPVFGLSLAGLLRGMVGDLSVTSMLLLSAAVWMRLVGGSEGVRDERDRHCLLLAVSGTALLLYPFALGLGPFDPYRFGFANIVFIFALAALAAWAIYRGLVLLPLVISMALLAWSQQIYESTNLWDYLIDVPLAIYAISGMLISLFSQIRRGKCVQTKSQ